MQIASRVRSARKRLGLSARALDEKAKLSPGHTALIERGERTHLSGSTLQKLALALGVTIEWLLGAERAA